MSALNGSIQIRDAAGEFVELTVDAIRELSKAGSRLTEDAIKITEGQNYHPRIKIELPIVLMNVSVIDLKNQQLKSRFLGRLGLFDQMIAESVGQTTKAIGPRLKSKLFTHTGLHTCMRDKFRAALAEKGLIPSEVAKHELVVLNEQFFGYADVYGDCVAANKSGVVAVKLDGTRPEEDLASLQGFELVQIEPIKGRPGTSKVLGLVPGYLGFKNGAGYPLLHLADENKSTLKMFAMPINLRKTSMGAIRISRLGPQFAPMSRLTLMLEQDTYKTERERALEAMGMKSEIFTCEYTDQWSGLRFHTKGLSLG